MLILSCCSAGAHFPTALLLFPCPLSPHTQAATEAAVMGAGRHVARRNRPSGMGLVPRGACRSGLGRSRRAITRELFLGCALAWGVVLCRSRILNFPPDASRLVNFSVHTVNMLNTPVTVLNFSLDAKVFEAGQAPAAPLRAPP